MGGLLITNPVSLPFMGLLISVLALPPLDFVCFSFLKKFLRKFVLLL